MRHLFKWRRLNIQLKEGRGVSTMNSASLEQHGEARIDAIVGNYHSEQASEIKSFYKLEEQFVDYLFYLEKEKAERVSSVLIDSVKEFIKEKQYPNLKYYLIGLMGIISKEMRKLHILPEKAFAFNSISIDLIEEKLNDENAVDLLGELIEFLMYTIEEKKQPTLLHQTVNEVIQYIDQKVQSPMTVEGLAQKFDVSTSHLSRIFREHAGITLVEYINIKKVEESQYYLRFSNQKISDISDNFNFCNQSYYTRIFKKYTGFTPRKFRNNIQGSYIRFDLRERKQIDDEE